MRKTVRCFLFVAVMALAAVTLAACSGGGDRKLHGTWVDGDTTYVFESGGTGSHTINPGGNAPKQVTLFTWDTDGDRLLLTNREDHEVFTFSFRLNEATPGMDIYIAPNETLHFRRDRPDELTADQFDERAVDLTGIWRRNADPNRPWDGPLSFRFHTNNEGVGIEEMTGGTRRSFEWEDDFMEYNASGGFFTTLRGAANPEERSLTYSTTDDTIVIGNRTFNKSN